MSNSNYITSILVPSSVQLNIINSFFLDYNGNLWSFGCNRVKLLGHNDTNKMISSPKQIPNLHNISQIYCSTTHTICCDYNGNCFTFGKNNGGLGIEKNISTQVDPIKVNNLPPIKQVACGNNFSFCLSFDNELYSFGINSDGQLGIGNTETKFLPQKITSISDIEFIECGSESAICKLYNNTCYSWGSISFGQLGRDTAVDNTVPCECTEWPKDVVSISCGFFHVLCLTANGNLYSCGSGAFGKSGRLESSPYLSLINDIPPMKIISAGGDHSMCVDIEDNLWVFGRNNVGQLGLGDTQDRLLPTKNSNINNIIALSHGGLHSFVKTNTNEIYTFGDNSSGQLGIEDNKIHCFPYLVNFDDIWMVKSSKSRAKSARK